MKKTLLKRFKMKKKTVLHLPAGQNHFRSKKRRKIIRRKRKVRTLSKEVLKKIKDKINK
jgi:ribosomal protein L35